MEPMTLAEQIVEAMLNELVDHVTFNNIPTDTMAKLEKTLAKRAEDVIDLHRSNEAVQAENLGRDKTTVGLYNKFQVTRTDGKSAPGKKHHNCEYFVLDLTHDRHALPALEAYARSCHLDFPKLGIDLMGKCKEMFHRFRGNLPSHKPLAAQKVESNMDAKVKGNVRIYDPEEAQRWKRNFVAEGIMRDLAQEVHSQDEGQICHGTISDAALWYSQTADIILDATANTAKESGPVFKPEA